MENKDNQANDDDFGLPDITPSASEERTEEQPRRRRKPEPEPAKKSAAPIVITVILIIGLAAAGVWYIFIRKPPKPVVVEQPKDTVQYVVEKPVEEPVIEEPKEPAVGTITVIEERTGRSYVVVGSFFDEDLADDYANKLITSGVNPKIIKPYGKNKFHRVAVEEFDSYNEAFMRAEALAQDYKEKPWALKY